MIVNLTPALRAALAAAALARLQADPVNPARIELRAAPMPGTPGDTVGIGALQAVLFLAQPAGAVADTTVELVAPIEGQRAAGALIAWARLLDGAGNALLDLDVTVSGAGGAVQLDRVDGGTGGFVRLTRLALAF